MTYFYLSGSRVSSYYLLYNYLHFLLFLVVSVAAYSSIEPFSRDCFGSRAGFGNLLE
jgi:hypothetical protein